MFVVDGDGVIRYAHRAIAGLTYRPTDELVAAVAGRVRLNGASRDDDRSSG